MSYIGITTKTVEHRFKEHIYSAKKGSNNEFHVAIKQQGDNNFFTEILEEVEDVKLLLEREKYWIQYYDTFLNGYNMTLGGENVSSSVKGKTYEEIYKGDIEYISNRRNLLRDKFRDKEVSDETKAKMKSSHWSKKKPEEFYYHMNVVLPNIKKDYIFSEEELELRSKNMKKYWASLTEEQYNNLCNLRKGHSTKQYTEEEKDAISRKSKERIYSNIIICPTCGFEGHVRFMMDRFHFSNCKRNNQPILNKKIVEEIKTVSYWSSLGYDDFEVSYIIRLMSNKTFYRYFKPIKFISYFRDFNRKNFRQTIEHIRKEILTLKYPKITDMCGVNPICHKWWTFRGYSGNESKAIISKIQIARSKKLKEIECYSKNI